MSVHSAARKVTTQTLQEMKHAGEKITMLTAYDFSLAKLVDRSGVDVILVGDSAANVMGMSLFFYKLQHFSSFSTTAVSLH